MSDTDKMITKAIKDVKYNAIRDAVKSAMKKTGQIKKIQKAVKKAFLGEE